ncbi:MAG: hypothetical protein AB7V50_04075 [Vampirovibrionia bacterium]
MYNHAFCLDEIESNGNKQRIENKIKAKNMMALAVNFIDDTQLEKISDVFNELSPAELVAFKSYLDNREYLKSPYMNILGHKVINKLCRIALYSEPKDEYLKGLFKQYKQNQDIIDDLKIQSTKTFNYKTINSIIESIDEYSEKNIELIEKVNKYRDKKYSK